MTLETPKYVCSWLFGTGFKWFSYHHFSCFFQNFQNNTVMTGTLWSWTCLFWLSSVDFHHRKFGSVNQEPAKINQLIIIWAVWIGGDVQHPFSTRTHVVYSICSIYFYICSIWYIYLLCTGSSGKLWCSNQNTWHNAFSTVGYLAGVNRLTGWDVLRKKHRRLGPYYTCTNKSLPNDNGLAARIPADQRDCSSLSINPKL